MELILSPKDNLNKIRLEGVSTFAVEGPTLLVVFENGETRNYPLIHLWYYSSHIKNHTTDGEVTFGDSQYLEEIPTFTCSLLMSEDVIPCKTYKSVPDITYTASLIKLE